MDRNARLSSLRPGACVLALALLGACGDGHDARTDSVDVAHLLARESVPVMAAGRTAEVTVTADAAGRLVDSVFRAQLAPTVARLRGEGSPQISLLVAVTRFRLSGDSAEAVVHRRGVDRADTTRFASSDTRYLLAWSRMNHWMVTATQPSNFQGEGKPSARPRDAWWDSTKAKAKAPATP
jgi:hypothetical protein